MPTALSEQVWQVGGLSQRGSVACSVEYVRSKKGRKWYRREREKAFDVDLWHFGGKEDSPPDPGIDALRRAAGERVSSWSVRGIAPLPNPYEVLNVESLRG